jgi:hypothetical protein
MTHKHMLGYPGRTKRPEIPTAASLQLAFVAFAFALPGGARTVAKEACQQLEKLYPLEDRVTDTDTCIANAIKNAKAQERALLASAGRK